MEILAQLNDSEHVQIQNTLKAAISFKWYWIELLKEFETVGNSSNEFNTSLMWTKSYSLLSENYFVSKLISKAHIKNKVKKLKTQNSAAHHTQQSLWVERNPKPGDYWLDTINSSIQCRVVSNSWEEIRVVGNFFTTSFWSHSPLYWSFNLVLSRPRSKSSS